MNGDIYVTVKDHHPTVPGELALQPGDWLLRYADGTLAQMGDEAFTRLYELDTKSAQEARIEQLEASVQELTKEIHAARGVYGQLKMDPSEYIQWNWRTLVEKLLADSKVALDHAEVALKGGGQGDER